MSRRAASWVVGIIAAGGVVAALLFFAVPALACQCSVGPAPRTVSPDAVVFTGTAAVVNISHPGAPLTFSSADLVEVLFDVEAVYRGLVRARAAVHTVASSVSCGFEFQ